MAGSVNTENCFSLLFFYSSFVTLPRADDFFLVAVDTKVYFPQILNSAMFPNAIYVLTCLTASNLKQTGFVLVTKRGQCMDLFHPLWVHRG